MHAATPSPGATYGDSSYASLEDDEEDADDGGTDDDDDEDDSDEEVDRKSSLQDTLCPSFWLPGRLGTPAMVVALGSFALFDGWKFVLSEVVYVTSNSKANPVSLLVAAHLLSLILAVSISLALKGAKAVWKIFVWHLLWRFLLISMLFTSASFLIILAYDSGLTSLVVVTLGQIYLPLSAVLSWLVFKKHGRRYGKLEWLALAMMTLALLTFVLLRERGKEPSTKQGSFNNLPPMNGISSKLGWSVDEDGMSNFSTDVMEPKPQGIFLVVSAAALSVMGSILAERIFKARSPHLVRARGKRRERFYILKVPIDIASLVVSSAIWIIPVQTEFQVPAEQEMSAQSEWFGVWTIREYCMVIVLTSQAWFAGLVTKNFSTVVKAVVQTLALTFTVCVMDPIIMFAHIEERWLCTYALAIIVFLAALIFQTGRLYFNMAKDLRTLPPGAIPIASAGVGTAGVEANASGGAGVLSASAGSSARAVAAISSGGESLDTDDELEDEENDSDGGSSVARRRRRICQAVVAFLRKNFLMLGYIFVSAIRVLALAGALSTSITPVSMSLMMFVCGAVFASLLTLHSHGLAGLRWGWYPPRSWEAMPVGIMFALSQTFMCVAYAGGISASVGTVLGMFYTPVSAFASSWVFPDGHTRWLQWFALLITTLASAVFGFLQATDPGAGSEASGWFPMLCVILSATFSALAALISEKFLKKELTEEEVETLGTIPFHVQKIPLDISSSIATVPVIFALGLISSRDKDAFWKNRPIRGDCSNGCPSESAARMLLAMPGVMHDETAECVCASGLFVGWADAFVIFALILNVLYGWLKGKLTKAFGTVDSAIADAFTPLAIYFIGDPLLNGKNISDMALNLVAFIVPLSSFIYTIAEDELHRIEAIRQARVAYSHVVDDIEEVGDSDSSSTSSENRRQQARAKKKKKRWLE